MKDAERGHHFFTAGLQFLILFLSNSPITNLQFCKISHYSPVKFDPLFPKSYWLGFCNLQSKKSRFQKHHFALIMKYKDLCLTSWHPLVLPSFPTSSLSSLFLNFLWQSRWSLLAKLSNWCFSSNLYMAFVLGLVYSVSRHFLAGFPREIYLQLSRLGGFFLTTLIK